MYEVMKKEGSDITDGYNITMLQIFLAQCNYKFRPARGVSSSIIMLFSFRHTYA